MQIEKLRILVGLIVASVLAHAVARAEDAPVSSAGQAATKAPAAQCPSGLEPEKLGLSDSAELNEVVQEIWKIEDETIHAGRNTNLYLGAALGGALYKTDKLYATVYAMPTVGLRVKKGGVPAYTIGRARQRLTRIKQYSLTSVESKLNESIKKAADRRADLLSSLDKLNGSKSNMSAEAPPSGDSLQLLKVVEEDYKRQLAEVERSIAHLNASLKTLSDWRCAVDTVLNRLTTSSEGFLGVETMIGYGFDLSKAAGRDQAYSGLVAGFGVNFSVQSLVLGLGPFVEQDGAFGVYLNLQAPVLE